MSYQGKRQWVVVHTAGPNMGVINSYGEQKIFPSYARSANPFATMKSSGVADLLNHGIYYW